MSPHSPAPQVAIPPPTWRSIGKSVQDREIRMYTESGTNGAATGGTLLIGGLHGDETATVTLMQEFCAETLGRGMFEQPVAFLPLANPDSYVLNSRYNSRRVDLNRNCVHRWSALSVEPSGTEPWSEPETRALRDFVLQWQPRAIVALHWALAEIDADGEQSRSLAETMWSAIPADQRGPYRMRVSTTGAESPDPDTVYTACPGSLGQWCGYMLRYPDGTQPAMITLELPYDPAVKSRPEQLADDHLDTLRKIWRDDSVGYCAAVRPGVRAMLMAACKHVA